MSIQLLWRTSSYSGVNGNCIEVAHIPANFHKSSYSGQEPNCVQVADLPHGAAVRDSKHPDAGHLALPAAEWAAFLTATRTGEL